MYIRRRILFFGGIGLLAALSAFLIWKYREKIGGWVQERIAAVREGPEESPAVSTADSTTESPPPSSETEPPTTETESDTESSPAETWSISIGPALEEFSKAEGARIWVGDSRTEALRMNVAYDPELDFFIAKIGEGWRWFSGEALPYLEEMLRIGNTDTVLIDLGVNDCALSVTWPEEFHASDYAAEINRLIDTYPEVRFCFYSVCPCSGSYERLNPEIDRFNAVMQAECRAEYIDTANLLKSEGFGSPDGLHYDQETCVRIYNYVLGIE